MTDHFSLQEQYFEFNLINRISSFQDSILNFLARKLTGLVFIIASWVVDRNTTDEADNKCDACGECCNTVMLPVDWFEIHQYQAVKPIIYTYFTDDIAIPFTNDGKCCFLNDDCKCIVHDDKADVCKNYICNGFNKPEMNMHSWIESRFEAPDGKIWVLSYSLAKEEEEDAEDLEGKKRKINFTEVITNHLREELGIPEAKTNV